MEVNVPYFVLPEVQPVRRFFAKFALATPALLTLAVTVHSKSSDDFTFSLVNKDVDQRIDAYIPVMRKSYPANAMSETVSPEDARRIAPIWVAAADQGQLKPIPLVRYAQSTFDGASGQILRTAGRITQTLESAATREAARGETELAVSDALGALRVNRIIEYSDGATVSLGSVHRRRMFKVIASVAPKLSPARRAELAKELRQFHTNLPALAETFQTTHTLYLREPVPAGAPRVARLMEITEIRRSAGQEPTKVVQSALDGMNREDGRDIYVQYARHILHCESHAEEELGQTLQRLETE